MRTEEISVLLVRWCEGDAVALAELTPLVYQELRRLARGYMRMDRNGELLQPTALVHEVWLKLEHQHKVSIQNRYQFYGLAAKMMRELLIDYSRRSLASKHGGGQVQVSLSEIALATTQPSISLLDLNDALTRLGKLNLRYTQIVELRYFGGLTVPEAAKVLKISNATVERDWTFARLWLQRELNQ